MGYHRTVCKVCEHDNELRLIRRKLGKTFRCAKCGYPYNVYLLSDGFIGIEKRQNRTKLFYRTQKLLSDFEYMNKLSAQKIKQQKKKFNQSLFEEFILRGKLDWVVKARSIFVEEAYMLGISIITICKYFTHHGGKIDKRTVQSYINQTIT